MTATRTAAASAAASELRPIASGDSRVGVAFSDDFIWAAEATPPSTHGDDRWLSEVVSQVNALLRLPSDWDGYGAAQLQFGAAERMIDLLAASALGFVRSVPHVAVTVDGGLLVRWESGGYIAQLESIPDGEVEAYFVSESGEEHEMPARQASSL